MAATYESYRRISNNPAQLLGSLFRPRGPLTPSKGAETCPDYLSLSMNEGFSSIRVVLKPARKFKQRATKVRPRDATVSYGAHQDG